MKSPFKNIYNVLKLNRFIVLAVIIGGVAISIVSVLAMVNMHQKTISSAFVVNTEGQVIPLRVVSQRENLQVEALAHLEHFHRLFYGIDAGNFESNLNKALWLGDSSVDNLYRQKKADGIYNRLLQYSLVQKVIRIESKVDLQSEPYPFETRMLFEINRGSVTDTYELVTSGALLHVERNFPHNPHGLLIKGFLENHLRKIENKISNEK